MLEHKSDTVPWTIKQTLIGLLFTLVPFALSFLLTIFSSRTPQPKVFSPQQDIVNAVVVLVVSMISEGFFLLAPLYFAYRTTDRSHYLQKARWRAILETLGFRRFAILPSLKLIVGFFVAIIAVNTLYSLIIIKFHLSIQTNDQAILERGHVLPITTYTILAAAVLIAPICEEIFFRSFTFMGFRRGMTLTLSIVISALIFAVAHLDSGSFPVLLFIGLALATIRWRTCSIWPGIILHMLNNATSALLIILSLHGFQF